MDGMGGLNVVCRWHDEQGAMCVRQLISVYFLKNVGVAVLDKAQGFETSVLKKMRALCLFPSQAPIQPRIERTPTIGCGAPALRREQYLLAEVLECMQKAWSDGPAKAALFKWIQKSDWPVEIKRASRCGCGAAATCARALAVSTWLCAATSR